MANLMLVVMSAWLVGAVAIVIAALENRRLLEEKRSGAPGPYRVSPRGRAAYIVAILAGVVFMGCVVLIIVRTE